MNLENFLLFLEEYKITPNEVFLIYVLFLAQPDEDKPEYAYKYISYLRSLNKENEWRKSFIKFQDIGIISKSYKIPKEGEKFYIENIEFNKNFIHKFLMFSGELGYELFEEYPVEMFINNKSYSLKNIGKKYNSLEDFCFAYGKAIKHNPQTHKKVLELLNWAKQNRIISYGICEFVISHKWKELQKLKDSGYDGNTLNIDELL